MPVCPPLWRRFRSGLLVVLGCVLGWTPGAGAEEAAAGPPARILVRFADDGPRAVEVCAGVLHARGDHRTGTRDHSDSLDVLRERYQVKRVEAWAPSGDREGDPLSARRAFLRERLQRAWEARVRRRSAHADRRAHATRNDDDAAGRAAAARGPGPTGTSAPGPAENAGSAASLPHELAARAARLAHVYQLELAPGVSAAEAAQAYADDPHVVWAHVDWPRVLDATGVDPYLESSGSWGQPYPDLWGHHRIGARDAWAWSRGEGVVVAVVDTGLDWQHPDIADNVFVHPGEDLDGDGRVSADEWNGIDDDGNGYVDDLVGFDFANSIDANGDGDYDDEEDTNDPDPFDDNGHGTHVAGIVAAVADNGLGIAGVAPSARIMALKGFKADGENSDALLWRAVLYAATNGADIVNNSWSCSEPCPRNPLAEEVVEIVHALGTTIVTSAGNRRRDVSAFSPENMWQTITVGSSDVNDGPSLSFTNQGFGVDVLAPGGDPPVAPGVLAARRNILSLRSSGGDPIEQAFEVGEDYIRLAGTSMSAPQVAGVAALLLAQHPEIGPDELRRSIRRSARDLGRPGHDWATGAGRLDAAAALAEPPAPDWLLQVSAPRAATWLDPGAGAVEVRGTILGDDVRRWSVSVGEGVQPETWRTLASSIDLVEDGLLVAWDVEAAARGAWVIHVEVEAFDGRRAHEYIPVSFERLRFEVLSSEGPAAERPAIHGRRVVWQSRRGEYTDRFGRLDHDLFEAGFGGLAERRLLAREGDQTQPSISGDHLGHTYAWLSPLAERPGGGPVTTAQACRLAHHGSGECRAEDIAGAGEVTLAPVAARDSVFWISTAAAQQDIAACRFDSRDAPCLGRATGLAPRMRGSIDGDGRRTVSWTDSTSGLRMAFCELDFRGECAETRLPLGPWPYTRAAASRDLVAWVEGRLTGDRPLRACVVEPAGASEGANEGACAPIDVVPHVEDQRVRVSGDLIVWDGSVGDQPSDVFFCEFDRLHRVCPVQRLTAEGSHQFDAVVDGRRIVWIDERFGPGRVLGVELPSWSRLGPRRARPSEPLRVRAWLDEAGHGGASLSASITPPDATGPAPAPPTLRSLPSRGGRRIVQLHWCPSDTDVGRHVFTLEATTPDGLSTRTSFAVEVEPPRERRADDWLGRRLGWTARTGSCMIGG